MRISLPQAVYMDRSNPDAHLQVRVSQYTKVYFLYADEREIVFALPQYKE